MTFTETAWCDPYKTCLFSQFSQIGRPHIPHPGTEPPHELENSLTERAAVGHPGFNPFSNQFP